jgi:hypothetical protein
MKKLNTSITNDSITTVIIDTVDKTNRVVTVQRTHPNFEKILEAVKNEDIDLIVSLLDNTQEQIAEYTDGLVSVKNGHVYYDGKLVGGIVVERILEFAKNGLPIKPLIRFLGKLKANPSYRAVTELYKFLEHRNMPITPDGNFIAYKGVQENFYSVTAGHITLLSGKTDATGHVYNGVGETILTRRNEVCDDPKQHCSNGLHAGSLEYARGFGSRMVLVEIDPINVVCIPDDCNCQKLRCCGYTVIGEYKQPLNNNYCDEYHSTPDDFDHDDNYNVEGDDSLDSINEEEVRDLGFQSGYDDGYQGAEHDDEPDYEEIPEKYVEAYKQSYSDGFNEGDQQHIEDRRLDDIRDRGFSDGMSDAYQYNSYGSNHLSVRYSGEELSIYEEGYNEGYDKGVKSR